MYSKVLYSLSKSKFRSSFKLSKKYKDYINSKGLDTIRNHAYDLISKRLAPERIENDGKQTPYRGHPVFIAQHATATYWFMKRYRDGFVDVRKPFYNKMVSRINFDDVDAIVFCTKNPLPIIKYLDEINKPILFHITLTPYYKDIEPNVISKIKIIDGIKKISDKLDIDNVYVRYDPILINDRYTIDYHIKAFNRMCSLLDGYVKHIIISFIDDYKNVRKNMDVLKYKALNENDYKIIGENFSKLASNHGMTVQTCAEENRLTEYGFVKKDCVDFNLAFV